MHNKTTASALTIQPSHMLRRLIVAMLAAPFVGCAITPLPTSAQTALSPAPVVAQQLLREEPDCFAISTLPEKRVCLAQQDQAFIDDCERMRPMACKPYRDLYFAEQTLQQTQTHLLHTAKRAYASYTENDPAYLDDLATYAQASNTAWRAYRDAQCALEPFAQGMSRAESEHLAEACRLAKTQARIAELDALKAATGP